MEFIFYIHLASLALAVVGIALADHAAFAWMRGKTDVVSPKALFTAHWIVTIALLGLVYTGLFLFWPLRNYLLGQPLFILKLVFVTALLINSFFIEQLMHTAANYSYASLNARQKLPLLISGAVSTGSWVGTVAAAWFVFGWPF